MSSTTFRVQVARKSAEAADICTFELVGVGAAHLPGFSAGSHIDVELPNGLTRQYSLCNSPAESHRYLIAVLKESGGRGGSRTMHESVREGDLLTVSAPKNHFALVHDARRHLLMAGGIGVTPLLCMAERLAAMGSDFRMHYATRSRERTAFMRRIRNSNFADKVAFHFNDGAPQERLDLPAVLANPDADTHLYVCGPKGFMDAVLGEARSQGWDGSQLHWEFFAGTDSAQRADDGSFDVRLARSGRVIAVAADKTVADALAEAGVDLPTSCEQGVCGTCLTRVLEGEPDHRDMYLSPEEQAANDRFLPCCSRSKSARLVLDL
jgi:vanillate O-demethylase ferredoxin subunit